MESSEMNISVRVNAKANQAEQIVGLGIPNKSERDSTLSRVTVKELVEKCGGDNLDEVMASLPIRHAEAFGDYTPEEIRQRTTRVFACIGLLS